MLSGNGFGLSRWILVLLVNILFALLARADRNETVDNSDGRITYTPADLWFTAPWEAAQEGTVRFSERPSNNTIATLRISGINKVFVFAATSSGRAIVRHNGQEQMVPVSMLAATTWASPTLDAAATHEIIVGKPDGEGWMAFDGFLVTRPDNTSSTTTSSSSQSVSTSSSTSSRTGFQSGVITLSSSSSSSVTLRESTLTISLDTESVVLPSISSTSESSTSSAINDGVSAPASSESRLTFDAGTIMGIVLAVLAVIAIISIIFIKIRRSQQKRLTASFLEDAIRRQQQQSRQQFRSPDTLVAGHTLGRSSALTEEWEAKTNTEYWEMDGPKDGRSTAYTVTSENASTYPDDRLSRGLVISPFGRAALNPKYGDESRWRSASGVLYPPPKAL